jgi:uncharacterized RDD family membrane protein YckC
METEVLDAGGDLSVEKDPRDYVASNSKRFGNLIVDTIMYGIMIFILTSLLYAMEIDVEAYFGVSLLINLSSSFLYYFSLESMNGKTLGKYLTKTRVVYKDGSTPTNGTIAKRALCRFIPFDALSFLSSYPIGWHDKFSDTLVIDEKTFNE